MANEPPLCDADRARLDQILDALIPANTARTLPSAGSLGLAGFILSATPYAPDPRAAVTAVLTCLATTAPEFPALENAQRIAALKSVEAAVPDAFATLVRLTYMGYYSRPDTRPFFGLKSEAVHPKGYNVPPETPEFMQKITAPVRARGQIYREE